MRLSFAATLASGLFFASPALAIQAQPVPIPEEQASMPQIEIDGTGISTLNYGSRAGEPYRPGLDFSDSALVVGAAERLFEAGGIGSFGLGILDSDAGVTATGASPLFVHQAFVDYQTEATEWLVGRSDNRAAHLVDFPTLRDEDLIAYTHPLNPFSNGDASEEHRYANVASFTLNQGLTYFEGVHVQHLIDSRGTGPSASGLNSAGVTFQYLCPPGKEALSRVVSYGVGLEHEELGGGAGSLNQLEGGGVINLHESMTDRVELRAQEIISFGSSLTTLSSLGQSFEASYQAAAASLRYLRTPFGRPGYQLSLTGGYRSYFGVAQARSWALAATAARSLGEGFDLVAQYRTEWRDTALAALDQGQPTANVAELGLVFNFGATFNRHLGPRRTVLNTEHGYVPE